MVDKLGPKIDREMRALCKKISIAHELDSEIQDELYGHLEDKMFDYLNGEETLSEEDALILVSKHFGSPSSLKGQLQDVHAFETQVSLFRRLSAAMVVTAACSQAYFFILFSVFLIWPSIRVTASYEAFVVTSFPSTIVLPWLILLHWQRRLDLGHAPWFHAWRPAHLAGLIVVLFAMRYFLSPIPSPNNPDWVQFSGIPMLLLPLLLVIPGLQCIVWLWWCDRSPRKTRALVTTAGIWGLWLWASFSVSMLRTFQGTLEFSRVFQNVASTFSVMAIVAIVAYGLYTTVRNLAARSTREIV